MDILSLLGYTATTATLNLGDGERTGAGYEISLYDSTQTTVLKTAVTDDQGNATFTGLTPGTTYYAYYYAAGYTYVRTSEDVPRGAMETQWAALIEKVKTIDPTTGPAAPTTATVGRLGQIQIDTTNADAYMCVAVDSVTPAYTWKKITP